MELGLEGRVALITGGSAGLGKATASALVAAGARVALVARGVERLDAAASELRQGRDASSVLAVPADVSRPTDVDRAVERVITTFGGIDILVNNAGTSMALPFLEADDEAWQADIDLKLLAAVRFSRLAVPSMMERGSGRIVNILNIGARHPGARSVPTTVSRAAGLALTKALSKEFAPHDILVNAVMIGFVKSDQWKRRWHEAGQRGSLDEWYASLAKSVPVGRIADAEELADLIAFLVSNRARFITGCAINFDGGQSAVP